MICKIRKWALADAADLAAALSNRKVQDNLRDGLPYPYTEQDGADFCMELKRAECPAKVAEIVDKTICIMGGGLLITETGRSGCDRAVYGRQKQEDCYGAYSISPRGI